MYTGETCPLHYPGGRYPGFCSGTISYGLPDFPGRLLLRIAIAALLIYSVIAIVNQQINISQKDQQMTDYLAQIEAQEQENAELKQMVGSGNQAYMEQAARETLNYAEPDERVFVNVAGN